MSTTPSSPVLAERRQSTLVLTINAPANRNSLQAPGVLEGLIQGLDQLADAPDLSVAIITGAGGAFSSGGDLRLLSSSSQQDMSRAMHRNAWLYRRIALGRKLVIAAVDGPAYGAGLGLAAACDWVVAGESAVFCSVFTRVGAMPDAALFWSLPGRVGIAHARRMMLTAAEIRGEQAVAMGLADEWNSQGPALDTALAAAARFARGPQQAFGHIKAGLRRAPMSLEQALDFQLDNAPGLFVGPEFQEGAAAFLEKRKPDFPAAVQHAGKQPC